MAWLPLPSKPNLIFMDNSAGTATFDSSTFGTFGIWSNTVSNMVPHSTCYNGLIQLILVSLNVSGLKGERGIGPNGKSSLYTV